MVARAFTPEQDQQIAAEYSAGATLAHIAAQRHSSTTAIKSAVGRGGVALRPSGWPAGRGAAQRRTFTPEQDADIARRYAAGESTYQIAAAFGLRHEGTVRSSLKRSGVTRRTSAENFAAQTLWTGSDEQVRELLELYRGGQSEKRLAIRFRCRTAVISDVLAQENEPLHPGAKLHPAVRGHEAEIARRYVGGASLGALAKEYGCTRPTISAALLRQGVQSRHGHPAFWTDSRREWVVEQYQAGRSQADIGAELGKAQASISVVLRAAGIRSSRKRERHQSWRGGRTKFPGGYVGVYATEEDKRYGTPNSAGYIAEHRLVMGRALGRPLVRTETVHHINGNRADNRLENLQLRQGQHGKGVVHRCRSCGSADVEAVELDEAETPTG